MTLTANQISTDLREIADQERAQSAQRFFKTGKGEYGEGDIFLGIRVPMLRKKIRPCAAISIHELTRLLRSPYHEERLLALMIFVYRFERGEEVLRNRIYKLYLGNTQHINNWDLVDSSASQIVGAHLANKSTQPLIDLAASENLWERRIAIIATHWFIRMHRYDETLKIAHLLIGDDQDLIHKAVGWMLREVGKRNQQIEVDFLESHYRRMPRTMLRYAIERFPEEKRQGYLKGRI